ncbi:MAG: helix-turn-helix domain-containing protein [Allosphingosinicella sp.]
MKRLKELRIARGLTQAQLAKQIGTTQQSVARWEAGTSVPSVYSLDSIAYALGTTISHLMGQRVPPADDATTGSNDDEEVFWGHLGLLYPGWKEPEWYPIGGDTRDRLWSALRNLDVDDRDRWVMCETLNNRMLAFRPDGLERAWLVDDDCDGPEGFWNPSFPLHDYSGHPTVVYRAMEEWLEGEWGIEEGDEEEQDRRKIVEDLIKEAKLQDPDKLHAFLHHTIVHTNAGTAFSVWIEPEDLWRALTDLELGFGRMFYAPKFGGEEETFLPIERLVLVNAPLLDALEGRASELAELEGAQQVSKISDFDWTNVADLSLVQAHEFMHGCSEETKAGLRVFAEDGPTIHASLLLKAGVENYAHFQSRVTKRTRTVTRNRNAFLFTWDDWSAGEGGVGHYAVSEKTFRSLRAFFNLD